MKFEGKTALVSGSTSGIGLGIARHLAIGGCTVILNSHEAEDEVEDIRAGLEKETGARVQFRRADATRPEQIAALVEDVATELGTVDILVNNVGMQHIDAIPDFPLDVWNQVQAINLGAALHFTKAVLPGMVGQEWGRVVNIASALGLVAAPFKSAYVSTKHGLIGLTKVTALEVAQSGVTCNAICPGYVWTPLVEKQVADQARTRNIPEERVIEDVFMASQPIDRFVRIEEVAALAGYLCSDIAAAITGAAIPIDGGCTAQ